MQSSTSSHELCRRAEGVCMALVQSLTDLAFSLLRPAEIEIAHGDADHAAGPIATAGQSHRTALEFLEDGRGGSEQERRELEAQVEQLFEAIRTTDWHRRQSTESIRKNEECRGITLIKRS